MLKHNYPTRKPMLWIAPPFIMGVAVAQALSCTWIVASAIFLIAILGVCLKRSTLTFIALLFGFGTVHYVVNSPRDIAQNSASEWSVQCLGENKGRLVAFRDYNDEWKKSSGSVNLYISRGINLKDGDQLICHAQLEPIDPNENDYIRSLYRRGARSTLHVKEVIEIKRNNDIFSRLERVGEGRLLSLGLSEDVEGVSKALVLGHKDAISDDVERCYIMSGTSHILALSGLHLGVLFFILNALLLWMPLMPRGHLIANILIIILLWVFALLTGCSGSVMRATSMFTILQLSKATSKSYNGLNSLCGAALIMVLFNMNIVYDIGFQLSFISVLAIMVWALPICNSVRSRWWIVEFVSCSLIFGVAATIATAPLVGYIFGSVSVLGPFTTAPMLFTLTGAVVVLLLWLAVPIGFVGGWVTSFVEMVLTVQNYLARWVASWGWGYIEVDISRGDLWFIYGLYLIITLGVYHIFSKRRV